MLRINGSSIIPAPLVNYRRQYQLTGDGRKLGKSYGITLTGSLLPYKGSPNSTGHFSSSETDLAEETIGFDSCLGALSRKQESLRAIFSQDGSLFEYKTPDGTLPSVTAYVKPREITFPDGLWVQVSPYTIELETDKFLSGPYANENEFAFAEQIASAEESFSVNPGETPYTYSISHNVSAVGKYHWESGVFGSSSWQYAKSFVNNQLGLGLTTATSFSPLTPSFMLTNSAMDGGIIAVSGLDRYNYIRTEEINELVGSYSVTESLILASSNYTDAYTLSLTTSFEGGNNTQSVAIQGQVKGLYVNLNDYAARYTNAKAAFDGYIKGQLYNRATSVASGVTLSNLALQSNVNYDQTNGTIDYNYTFDNRTIGSSGVREEWTVSQNRDLENYLISVKIDGTIFGRSDTDLQSRSDNSEWAFDNLLKSSGLYIRAAQYSAVSGLLPLPQDFNKTSNPIDGSVSYSVGFNNRLVNSAREEYTVQRNFSRTEGIYNTTVAGTITGFATNVYDISSAQMIVNTKFDNASGYYMSILPLIPLRAKAYGYTVIQTGVVLTESVGINYLGGTIDYSYGYDSSALPLFSGALSEQITVTDLGSGQVFVPFVIPGRRAGPIIQDINTRTGKSRSLNIELIMSAPTQATYSARYGTKPDPSVIVAQLRPSGWWYNPAQENYNINTGHYSYNITWIENT